MPQINDMPKGDLVVQGPGRTNWAENLRNIDWKRIFFTLLGIFVFLAIYYSPPWKAAIDPFGVSFELSHEAKGALALFGLAAVWWVFEVIPIGITSLAIGALQSLFLVRDPKVAFRDFMESIFSKRTVS